MAPARDKSEIEKLVDAAAEGDAQAQFDLGSTYELGYESGADTKANVRLAARYYRKAAESGHIEAQMTMAKLCLLGKGVQQDPEEAAQWYLLAAEQGHRPAQLNLAEMYACGRGVEKDLEQSAKWIAKSLE